MLLVPGAGVAEVGAVGAGRAGRRRAGAWGPSPDIPAAFAPSQAAPKVQKLEQHQFALKARPPWDPPQNPERRHQTHLRDAQYLKQRFEKYFAAFSKLPATLPGERGALGA